MSTAMSNVMSKVLVAIVNYRTGDLVADCLRSLAPEVGSVGSVGSADFDAEVVVVDNAGGDDSPERLERLIREEGWSWASVRRLPRNGGFAYGNNEAVRPSLESGDPPDFVWLLNPDTIVRPGGLGELVKFMRDRPAAGLAGSRLEDPDGTPQRSAFRFFGVASELENALRLGLFTRLVKNRIVAPPVPSAAEKVQWLSGASLFVRREVYEKIGYMDERFFMYFEETDFCRRSHDAGFEAWYVPASRVVHLVGQASGIAVVNKPRPRYWFESRRRYLLKHLGRGRAALADAAWMAGFASWRARRVLQRKPDPDPRGMLSDFARNSVFSRGFRLDD